MEDIGKDSLIHELSIQMNLLIHEFERATGMKVLDFYGQWIESQSFFRDPDLQSVDYEIEITVDDHGNIRIGGTYKREELTVELKRKEDKK